MSSWRHFALIVFSSRNWRPSYFIDFVKDKLSFFLVVDVQKVRLGLVNVGKVSVTVLRTSHVLVADTALDWGGVVGVAHVVRTSFLQWMLKFVTLS